ncbi:hypothetical protein JTB14_013977 [Gonioctena quinquepunctata]|nr:hypothetical protein JTB14_013977 [Gonioctena quinquepunctata]
MDSAPPRSTWACNPSGWIKLDVFTKWFDHFLNHTKPSAEDPGLLILDGHLLTVFQIANNFGEAYLKAAVPLNAINEFAKTDIYPPNPDVFTVANYVAAATTGIESNESSIVTEEEEHPMGSNPEQLPPMDISLLQDFVASRNNTPSPSPNPINGENFSVRSPLSPMPSTRYACNRSASPSTLYGSQNEHFYVTPAQIHPLPKIVDRRSHLKRNTSILTTTPYTNYSEEATTKKTDNGNRKTLKHNVKIIVSKNKQRGKGLDKGMSNKRNKINISEFESSDIRHFPKITVVRDG